MKIRLIEPISPSRHLWSKSYFVRLGLPMIGAALVEAGHDVRIFNPQLAPIDWADVYSSDLVGISSTTSTIPEAYRICDDLRRRGIPVVIGGSHVTFMADEALEHADYVARGEAGEIIMAELAEALSGSRELVSITGISYRGADGQAVHAPLHERCADLDLLPFPDLTLVDGWERISNTPIMTSWGCPFDCTFCSVTAMFGKKYRFRSAESVVEEIKQKNPERIFFYDDNMAANRKRLKRLLQLMIDEGITVPWGAQVRTDVVRDPELMELMRASKCDFVALGLESVNQATLDGFEKSQTVGDIEHAIKVLHDYGIRAHGMFVLGADHDTPDAMRETVKFAQKNKIDTVMLNILTPLPGTQQFQELEDEGRIIEHDWSFYDAQHVVFQPKQMTAAAPAAGDDQGQQALLRHLAPGLALHKWLWTSKTRAAERKKAFWDRMLEYGWLWYYSRTWWTDAKNRAQRKRLRVLSRQQPLHRQPPRPPAAAAGLQPPAAEAGEAEKQRRSRPGEAAALVQPRRRLVAGLVRACLRRARGRVRGARRAAGSGARHHGPQDGHMATATFAAGCFWGVEQRFAALPGVTSTEVGYTGGTTENPTYEDVCSHKTGHAEAVRLEYDPDQISYQELLAHFFSTHDPTQWNRQGPDVGDQYRSAVFFHDQDQEKAALEAIAQLTESSGVQATRRDPGRAGRARGGAPRSTTRSTSRSTRASAAGSEARARRFRALTSRALAAWAGAAAAAASAYPTRCSSRILRPIPMRMRPPTTSMRRPSREPKRQPSSRPTTVRTPATTPITSAGHQMLTPSTASERPTASASMLVAMESMTSLQPLVGSHRSTSSSWCFSAS